MAQLPKKLIERLNTRINEIGDYKLGTLLQACLDQIAGGAASTVLMPVFPSQSSYAASNTVTEGSFFANSNTKTINYFVCGLWHEIDIPSLQAQITANSAQIALNLAEIVNLNAQLLSLTTAFNGHTHDGVNTQKIEIKGQLVTGAPQGHVLYVNAGQVDCMALDPTIDILSEGTLVEDMATGINFVDDCFQVTTVGGVAQVSIPTLKSALVDIANNTATISTNIAAIAALNVAIANLTTNVTQNATDIANHYAQFLSHNHTGGVNGPQLDPIFSLISPDGGGNVVNQWILTADGAGGVQWLNPAVLTMPINLCGRNIGGVGAVDPFIQVAVADDCFEFRKIQGECGITASIDAVDNHINIGIDFPAMNDIGVAVDPVNDFILVHDVSTGQCVKTNVNNLLAGATSYVGGKNVTVTPTATPNVSEIALDLGSIVTATTLSALDPVNDFVVVYDQSANDCVKIPISDLIHPISSIDDLSDVDTSTTGPTTGQTLIWDGTNWVPGDNTLASIDEHTDVDTTTVAPNVGEVLTWDGTNWVPQAGGSLTGIGDLPDVCEGGPGTVAVNNTSVVNSSEIMTTVNDGRGQSFTAAFTGTLDSWKFLLSQSGPGLGGFVRVNVYADVAGSAGALIGSSDLLAQAAVPNSSGPPPPFYVTFNFSTPVPIVSGTRYHVGLDLTQVTGLSGVQDFRLFRIDGYPVEEAMTTSDGGATWTNMGPAVDLAFEALGTSTVVNDCDILKYDAAQSKWVSAPIPVQPTNVTETLWQEKIMTTNNQVNQLNFNNVIPGKTYRLSFYSTQSVPTGQTFKVIANGIGGVPANLFYTTGANGFGFGNNSDQTLHTYYASRIFTASGANGAISFSTSGTGTIFGGNPNFDDARAILEELPYHTLTNIWT